MPENAASVSPPSHVPPELVVDVDFYNLPGAEADVFGAWKAQQDYWRTLRGGNAPLVWTPRNGGHWIAARADDLETLYADTEHLSNSSISIPSYPGPRVLPGQSDGAEHAVFRSVVMKAFNPKAIAEMRGAIRQIAKKLIDEIEPRGQCDFVAEFGYRLPIILFLSMMELPIEDGDYLLAQAHRTIRASTESEKHDAIVKIFSYVQRIVGDRRLHPGSDLISRLHGTEINGARMTQEAVHGITVNLLLGGLDTVASMLGFIMQHLAGNAGTRRRLAADRALIDRSLDEIIRRFPIASLARVVACDFEHKGLTLKRGERLFLPTALHSFDDDRFADPMRLDLDRKRTTILSFGRGPHQCLGSYLARVELAETLGEWLARIPDFEIVPGSKVIVASGAINAIKSLRLQWVSAAA